MDVTRIARCHSWILSSSSSSSRSKQTSLVCMYTCPLNLTHPLLTNDHTMLQSIPTSHQSPHDSKEEEESDILAHPAHPCKRVNNHQLAAVVVTSNNYKTRVAQIKLAIVSVRVGLEMGCALGSALFWAGGMGLEGEWWL